MTDAPPAPTDIAVIVPCHDHGAFLAEAIDSVRAQTRAATEVVVVDDGSTDPATVELFERWPWSDVALVRLPENCGLSAARNAGITHTRSPWLCCLDADDRLAPTWLAEAAVVLDEEPDVAFVSHWLRTFGDEEGEWKPQRCDLDALLDLNSINGAALFRRSMVEAVGGFDESMREGCEDWELWIRAVAQGHRGVIVPRVLYEYRRRADSMSRVMHESGGHRRARAFMIEAHRAEFEERLASIALKREWSFAHMVASVRNLDEEWRCVIEPLLAQRRAECERGERRARDAAALLDCYEELDRRGAEIDAFRASLSWRTTAWLRWLGALLSPRGRPRP